MTSVLRIATRASELGLRRARTIQAMLAARQQPSELVTFRTSGDMHFENPVSAAAARVAFTKELEQALTKGRADVAVHAYTDLSTAPSPGLTVAAVPPRDDARDALVLNELFEATSLAELPRGTRVGAASVRVRAMVRALFPELEPVHLRGDLPARLRKVNDGQVHATVVSAAALHLLEVSQRVAGILQPPDWLPAPAQGAMALQIRENDAATREVVAPLDDARTRLDTTAERAFLAALEGGPQSPIGALTHDGDGERLLFGLIVDPEGIQVLRAHWPMDDAQPELVGIRLANELRGRGASRILDAVRAAARVPAPQPE
jgi:hydroxymethylbilane synthase